MKKTILALCAVVLAFVGFVAGKMFAERQTRQLYASAHERLTRLNELSQYTTFRNISQTISAKSYDHAACLADVTASVYYRELQSCLADAECRRGVEDAVKKDAPELLTGEKKFKYYESSQRCTFRQ